jgi:hypothetical protein
MGLFYSASQATSYSCRLSGIEGLDSYETQLLHFLLFIIAPNLVLSGDCFMTKPRLASIQYAHEQRDRFLSRSVQKPYQDGFIREPAGIPVLIVYKTPS